MILVGKNEHFTKKEMKESTNLNFKHCASTGLTPNSCHGLNRRPPKALEDRRGA